MSRLKGSIQEEREQNEIWNTILDEIEFYWDLDTETKLKINEIYIDQINEDVEGNSKQ